MMNSEPPVQVGRLGLLGMAMLGLAGCGNAGADLGFGSSSDGEVTAFVYLDRDGSMAPNPLDTVLTGVGISLVALNGTDTVATGVTDTLGLVTFADVPLGSYRLEIDSAGLGDSILVQDLDHPIITLRSEVPLGNGTFRVGYPQYTISEARALPAGELVLVTGVQTAAPGFFSDSTAFIQDSAAAIRLPGARDGGGITTSGDSVRVVGTTGTDQGQPVLLDARVYVFIGGPTPAPDTLATGVAARASGGLDDAAFVVVQGASLVDTSTVAGSFRVRIDDGTGVVAVVFDSAFTVDRSIFAPSAVVDAEGLLAPVGGGVWVIRPRSVGAVTVQ